MHEQHAHKYSTKHHVRFGNCVDKALANSTNADTDVA